tara:strand:+ start:810 stop:1217 length:408 start_codon:yes stop_codon:yes gene_type:complete
MSRESLMKKQRERRLANKNKKKEDKKGKFKLTIKNSNIRDKEARKTKVNPNITKAIKSAGDKLKDFGKARVDEFKTRSGIKSSSKSTDKPKKGSNKEAIMIGGRRASITQKKLLKGGWTVKELEAKMKKKNKGKK